MSIHNRVHRWIADPPGHLASEGGASYAMTHYVCLLGLLTHVAWLAKFFLLGDTLLGTFNMASVLVFAVAVSLVRRGRLTLALSIASIEAICHAIVATVHLGWTAYYQLYLFIVIYIWWLYTDVSRIRRFIFTSFPILIYFGLYYYLNITQSMMPAATISPTVIQILSRINLLTGLLFVAGGFGYYIYSAARTWNSGRENPGALDRVLHLGVRGNPEPEVQRIRTVNFIAFCAFILASVYSVAFFFLGWSYAAWLNVGIGISYSITLLLNISLGHALPGSTYSARESFT